MLIISNCENGQRLAKKFKSPFISLDRKVYPDGETALKLSGEAQGVKKIIYFQFSSDRNFDADIVDLLSLLYYINNKKQTSLILPYLPYARSLPLKMEYEINKLGCFLEKLAPYIGRIFLIKPHCHPEVLEKYLKMVKINCINLEGDLAEFIVNKSKNPILVSPDKGFSGYVKKLAKIIGKNYIILEKKRITPEKVEVKNYSKISKENLEKSFIIVDDIISTGGTLLNSIKYLKANGVKNITCLIIHNLLKDEKVLNKFKKQGVKLFYTNSLGYKDAQIDVINGVYEFLKDKNYG